MVWCFGQFYLQPMSGIGEGHEEAIKGKHIIGKDMGLGAIQLKLRLDFSHIGEFWSHFTPEVAPPAALPEFDLNELYGDLFRVIDCIHPSTMNVGLAVVAIPMWENVVVTWFWFGILVGLTYYPGYIPAAFHLLLLYGLFLNRVDKIKHDSEAIANRQHARNAKESSMEEEERAATLGWIGSVTNVLPLPKSTTKMLQGVQAPPLACCACRPPNTPAPSPNPDTPPGQTRLQWRQDHSVL